MCIRDRFNVITGMYNPTEGKVEMLGQDVTGWKPYRITELGFSRTFQNIRLFPRMTVQDNVIVGMHTRTKMCIRDRYIPGPGQERHGRQTVLYGMILEKLRQRFGMAEDASPEEVERERFLRYGKDPKGYYADLIGELSLIHIFSAQPTSL